MSDKKARRIARGTFLKGAGATLGATLVLVAGGGVWRAADQGVFGVGEGPAYEPWKNWRTNEGEGPIELVRAAVLAANAHNSQPWLFRVEDSRIDLFADRERNIGAVDPYLREMYMSLGCALENLLLAAEANGYGHELALLPDGSNPAHAARIDLTFVAASASELYEAIPDRHTNRGPYDTERAVPQETLEALRELGEEDPEVRVFWFATDAERRRVGDLILEATEAITADEEQSADNLGWNRFDWDELQRYRDGLTLDVFVTDSLTNFAAKVLPPPSREQSDQSWLRSTREDVVGTAAAFGILAVNDKWEDAQRLRGGRAWQRMHLWGTILGLAMQPLNQMTERADREAQLGIEPRFGDALKELIGDVSRQALMPFRIGYPMAEADLAPRRAVEDVLA
jgi:hypothetical protein